MPQEDLTSNRPKNYSIWHRQLPFWCYQTDGDFFEQRKDKEGHLKAVAYIETIQIPEHSNPLDYPVWRSKKALAEQISGSMGISGYYVWHYPNCNIFFVQNVEKNNTIKMYENDYIEFIKRM